MCILQFATQKTLGNVMFPPFIQCFIQHTQYHYQIRDIYRKEISSSMIAWSPSGQFSPRHRWMEVEEVLIVQIKSAWARHVSQANAKNNIDHNRQISSWWGNCWVWRGALRHVGISHDNLFPVTIDLRVWKATFTWYSFGK